MEQATQGVRPHGLLHLGAAEEQGQDPLAPASRRMNLRAVLQVAEPVGDEVSRKVRPPGLLCLSDWCRTHMEVSCTCVLEHRSESTYHRALSWAFDGGCLHLLTCCHSVLGPLDIRSSKEDWNLEPAESECSSWFVPESS